MNQSRYTRYDKRRLPVQKRTIPIFGAASYIDGRVVKDQSDTFFRCWNCGFICRTDRDKLGNGVGYVVKDQADVPSYLNLGASAFEFPGSDNGRDVRLAVEDGATMNLMQLDSDGNPVTVMHNFYSKVTSGCPFCGTRQYK
jgi:hypothetical protein